MVTGPGRLLATGHVLGAVYLVAALASAAVAALAWHRRASSATARGLAVILAGTAGVALADSVCALVAAGALPPRFAAPAIAATSAGTARSPATAARSSSSCCPA
jgi:lipopolysaccharide export LptBFGC system permease protein LptF